MNSIYSTDYSTDPHGELDPYFPRYRAAVVRNWWVIGASALVVGLVAALVLGGSSEVVGARVTVDRSSDAVLEPVDLEEAVGSVPAVSELRSVALSLDEPDGVEIAVGGDESVVLSVTGETESAASDAIAAVLDELSTYVAQRRADVAAALSAGVESDQALLEQQIADLDAELGSQPAQQLRDVYLYQRQTAVDDLTLAQRRAAALTSWPASAGRIVVAGTPTTTSDSRALWAVVGLVLGAILGLAGVLVAAHVDRRVWTRSDVTSRGIGPVLPIVPDDGAEREVVLAGVRRAGDQAGNSGPVAVVAADERSLGLATTIAERVEAAPGPARTIGQLHEVIADGGARPVLVVATIGATSTDDIVRGAEYAETLGVELAGVVLGGVNARGARRAGV